MNPDVRQAKLGERGTIVIPADFRAALNLEVGQVLNLRVEGGTIILEAKQQAVSRLRGKYASLAVKAEVGDAHDPA
jgi:AbrB family looped-hinge helix DNA binding protein